MYLNYEIKLIHLNDYLNLRFTFSVFQRNYPKVYDNCAFYFWFYTAFLEDNRYYFFMCIVKIFI